jgi:predicted metal-dependent hydrolase
MWLNGRSDASGFPVPIEVRAVRGARRLRLRFDESRGVLKLTCPLRTSRRAALAWAFEQRDWVDAQVARALPAEPFAPDAVIPVGGKDRRLVWAEGAPRTPQMNDGELRCGGPLEGFARRIELFLKRLALSIMSGEAAEFALAAGVEVHGISVGDAGTRWGSCSSQGRIRLSWRLILAAPQARRYVVAHEVAHLVHLNHGPEFKALEARLFGSGLAEAKASLRREAPRLRRIGR